MFLSIHCRKLLFHAQVQSILTYGIGVWGNMICKSQLKWLQKVQNQSVNLVDLFLSTNEAIKQHRILRINELIQLENYKIWSRYHANQLPENLMDVMGSDHKNNSLAKVHAYLTRSKKESNLPVAYTTTYRSSFLFQGLRLPTIAHGNQI